MYTRCPSCRAEISFEPPADAASLPDGYKHRIKCPSCGVTIGVKLPNRTATGQPVIAAEKNSAPYSSGEPIYGPNAYAPAGAVASGESTFANTPVAKKSGRSRNVTVFIFSLLFLACAVIGYLLYSGTISVDILGGLTFFDGITVLQNASSIPVGEDAMLTLSYVLPAVFFLFTLVVAVVAIIGFIVKKYSRLLNVLFALIMLALTACIVVFNPASYIVSAAGGNIADYFMSLLEQGVYFIFVPVGLAFINFICSLIFLKSMKKKIA